MRENVKVTSAMAAKFNYDICRRDLKGREEKEEEEEAREKSAALRSDQHSVTNTHRDVNNSFNDSLPARKLRDVSKDMEALILSRQDDPFLQVYHCQTAQFC